MYSTLSLKSFVFYKLKKLFRLLFTFDSTWRIGSIIAFIVMFVVVILSVNVNAQASTPLSSGDTNCGKVLVASVNWAIEAIAGTNTCSPVNSSAKNLFVPTLTNSELTPTTTTTGTTGYNPTDFRYGGAISAIMFGAGAMADVRPASTYDAVVYQANQAGLVTHAQTQGFTQFAPISILWGIFRNIALLLFVVVFVAIGFFILIQRKIGGQETVSLVSSITNAAVAMIFITFSYAIGGIIVDIFTNVMNGVVASTFDGYINAHEVLSNLDLPNSNVNILTLMNELTNIGVSSSAANLFQATLSGLRYPAEQVKQVFSNINVGPNIPFTGLNFGSAIGFFSSAFVDILTGIITTGFNNNTLINAIVAFIIFIVMIRVVLALLGAYISIVFTIMFAPFILLPAALPGNSGKAISGWVMSLISSALTFPAVFACILMAAMFLNLNANVTDSVDGSSSNCQYDSQLNPGSSSGTIAGNLKASKYLVVTRNNSDGTATSTSQCYPLVLPPKFNYWPAPLGFIQGVEPDDLIRFVIAFAFIVLIPAVPKMIGSLLKVQQNSLLGGISEQFKGGTGAFGALVSNIPSMGIGKALGSISRSATDSIR